MHFLRAEGFSDTMIGRFFAPFSAASAWILKFRPSAGCLRNMHPLENRSLLWSSLAIRPAILPH